ncbi:MAG: DUF3299 domain-containing protein [Planctomycetota bacterium]|jgi:hypothetical protein
MPRTHPDKGAVRPLWIAVAVVTCVVFGSTLNRCLTCFGPRPEAVAADPPLVRGELLDAPFPEEAAAPPAAPPEPVAMLDWRREDPTPARRPQETRKPPDLLGHLDLTFDKLASYPYEIEEMGQEPQPRKEQIPASVKALHGKKIAIKGFMVPLKNDGEEVVEFVLLRNQGACCFGIVPRMNEWIHVTMEPTKIAPYAVDVPLTVFGTLEVGEVFENGLLMSIYRMESTRVLEPAWFR